MLKTLQNPATDQAFERHMEGMILPAYLLTGSEESAIECLMEAWDPHQAGESTTDSDVPARRAVINAAVRRAAPDIHKAASEEIGDEDMDAEIRAASAARRGIRANGPPSLGRFLQAMFALNPFERAALVLCLYEGMSLEEGAALLRVPVSAFRIARKRSLARLLRVLIVREPIAVLKGLAARDRLSFLFST